MGQLVLLADTELKYICTTRTHQVAAQVDNMAVDGNYIYTLSIDLQGITESGQNMHSHSSIYSVMLAFH